MPQELQQKLVEDGMKLVTLPVLHAMKQRAAPLVWGVPKYQLSQNYYITASYFWTINLGRRNVIITSQKSSWNYFWALLTRDLKDFRTVISGECGPLGELISGAVT